MIERAELAKRLIESAVQEREGLLRNYSDIADVELAHILKDICLEGWSSDPNRALAAANTLKQLTDITPDPTVRALYEWSLGLEYLIAGDMEMAIASLDRSEHSFLELGAVKLAASTQVSKLVALAMLGRYDEAITCGLRSREVFMAESDLLNLGKIEHNLGNIFFRRDRYREAEEFQRSALEHFKSVGDLIQLTKIGNSLALTLSQQHLTKQAEQLYEEALQRAESVGLKSTQAEIESSIGTLALYQGYYDRALDYLERSRRKYADLDLPHVLAMTEQEIADTYLDLNLAPEAIEIYERVEKQFSQLGMLAEQARALAYHAKAEISLGNFDQAQRLLANARELYVGEGNAVGAAMVELTEAQLFYAQGDFVSTQAAARHAESVLASGINPRRMIFARWLQGEAARLQMQWTEAASLLKSTLDLAMEQPDILARCYTSLGLLAIEENDIQRAEKELLKAADIIERLRAPLPAEEFRSAFFSDKLVPYTQLAKISLASLTDRTSEAFGYIEKARSRSLVDVLGGSISVEFHAQNRFEQGLVDRLSGKRHELSYFYNQLNQLKPTNAAQRPEVVKVLQREVNERESEIAEITRQLRHSAKQGNIAIDGLDLERLQASLGAERALIEYATLEDELLVFVVTNERIQVLRNVDEESQIAKDVSKFRFQIDSLRFGSTTIRKHLPVLTDRIQQHLQRLYDKLVRSVIERCANRDLVIVPSGWLHYLPFHALHDGERYLIEDRAVSYASSATVLQQCLGRTSSKFDTALLMGVPDEQTPQIRNEIIKLQTLFPTSNAYIAERANLDTLKQSCQHVDLLHLACHAQFRPDNPQFSALKLGDGWLTATDAAQLKLRSGLVTLSACETGLNAVAPGEELIGLARGFLSAGAAAVLMSLWTVDDQATHDLMAQFYSDLKQNKAAAKALQNAQVQMLRVKPHPFFWSPFVLTGHWGR